MIITSGYELSTAITNLLIFITSLILIFKIKNKSFKWFYSFILIDSLMGVIVHGIKMSSLLNTILWVILYLLFCITFNLLLHIFCNMKIKKVLLISLLSFIMMFGIYMLAIKKNIINLDNIVMLIYAIIIVLISLYKIIKKTFINKLYILGIIIQIIGIIPIFFKLNIWYLNYNGICHLFTLITIIIFYFGIKKENEKALK